VTAFAFGEQTSVREDSYQAGFKRSRPDLPCIHVYSGAQLVRLAETERGQGRPLKR